MSQRHQRTRPRNLDDQRELRDAALAAYVEKTIGKFPPLTRDQIEKVAAILIGVAEPDVESTSGSVVDLDTLGGAA